MLLTTSPFRAPRPAAGGAASILGRLALAGLLAAGLLLGGCTAFRHKEDVTASPESMYKQAT